MFTNTENARAYANGKNRRVLSGRNLWSGVLFGVGTAAFVDEAVFHQLLHWHHFYDLSTSDVGLVSDGLFHAFSWFATIASLFLFADLRRRNAFWPQRWIGGMLIGAGAFQLYDGTIQHKLLKLHQIRYDVDILPYDLAWNAIAVLLLLLGAVLLWKTRQPAERTGS
ncbi:DUF2243 domain-containing protein [Planococcus glaciei]|uniref:DUF2243 domain-containing protein n=1 Tax=Planococcus glaciei TaxID=459472 RepID=UPI00088B3560|nr:DUF2243 domain-containing protein [Planococcus glaciei]MBX0314492.1 DUF2243 domain-containing protein [Planococcus glaciei]MCP2033969.1 putative membrane protein [Planomicrobium sp. HSC-17F08]SDG69382.1 Uncharacterized membrane protein [Planococcus glaciei]